MPESELRELSMEFSVEIIELVFALRRVMLPSAVLGEYHITFRVSGKYHNSVRNYITFYDSKIYHYNHPRRQSETLLSGIFLDIFWAVW